jgi:DNA polymerase-3 subunit epsilon
VDTPCSLAERAPGGEWRAAAVTRCFAPSALRHGSSTLKSGRPRDLLAAMRASLDDVCGCFPTGRHYPGIADLIASTVVEVAGLSRHLEPTASWSVQKLAVIDCETTGRSPTEDRVLEVGVACFEGGELTKLESWLCNPGIPVPEESRAIHNISDEELAGAPPFAAIVQKIVRSIDGHLPVAYNAEFDRAFLHAELARAGFADKNVPPAFDPEVTWVDPLVWARELHKDERGHRLGEVCARLGVALDNAHRAASDAQATGRVLLALAPRMPTPYSELIRLQSQYGARQDVDLQMNYRRRG